MKLSLPSAGLLSATGLLRSLLSLVGLRRILLRIPVGEEVPELGLVRSSLAVDSNEVLGVVMPELSEMDRAWAAVAGVGEVTDASAINLGKQGLDPSGVFSASSNDLTEVSA